MQGTQLNAPGTQHPRNAGTLWSRVGAVETRSYAAIEHIEVFGQHDTRLHHVQVVNLFSGATRERAREIVCLLLIVSLDADAITWHQDRLEQRCNV